VEGAINLYEHLIGKRLTRMGEITGLANPNSGPQLLPWLQEHGYRFDDLKKGHVQRGLEQAEQELKDSPHSNSLPALVEVLKIRKDTARASPKKFYAIDRALDHESGVLRNTLQFAGAGQTWRWAGRMFQPQNLPRPAKSFEKIVERVVRDIEILPAAEFEAIYGDLIGYDCMEALVSCIRSMAQAPDGKMLYAADLNAIENRVLGWLSGDRKIMRVFELDRDPYIDFATYLWGLPYDDLYREYKELGVGWRRQIAKPGVLGCGYQLSAGKEHLNSKTGEIEATGLLGYARDMGINLTAEQAEHSVKTWRSTFTDAVEFWWEIEKAAKKCVQTGERTRCTYLAFEMNGAFLQMVLPSGRRLSYCRPRLEMKEMPWGGEKLSLTYETLNDKKQWTRDKTHGGKLTENGDQAISRDILARGMRVAHRRGLDIRLSVHDELVGLADEDKAEQHLAILKDSMLDQDDWAKKLPLKVAGFVSKVFKKD
jgi:DNA polymerase